MGLSAAAHGPSRVPGMRGMGSQTPCPRWRLTRSFNFRGCCRLPTGHDEPSAWARALLLMARPAHRACGPRDNSNPVPDGYSFARSTFLSAADSRRGMRKNDHACTEHRMLVFLFHAVCLEASTFHLPRCLLFRGGGVPNSNALNSFVYMSV